MLGQNSFLVTLKIVFANANILIKELKKNITKWEAITKCGKIKKYMQYEPKKAETEWQSDFNSTVENLTENTLRRTHRWEKEKETMGKKATNKQPKLQNNVNVFQIYI